jgi:hypothetical protein
MSAVGRLRFIAVATAAVVIPVALARRRARQRLAAEDTALRMGGLVGRGTVLSSTRTGRADGDGRLEVELQLDVFVPRFRRFVSSTVVWATPDQLGRLEPGKAVPITADADEPGRVVVAFDMDEPQSIAGLAPIAGGPGGPKVRTARGAGRDSDR